MPGRLPELSYRLAHHFPAALPFIIPFYNKLAAAGFDIDERKIKPVIRRNGRRIVTDYETAPQASVLFRFYGEQRPITAVNFTHLLTRIQEVRSVRDYAEVDNRIDDLVRQLEQATPSPR
jgi:hypothetical protein